MNTDGRYVKWQRNMGLELINQKVNKSGSVGHRVMPGKTTWLQEAQGHMTKARTQANP